MFDVIALPSGYALPSVRADTLVFGLLKAEWDRMPAWRTRTG
jgi:hypothetical protein